MGYSIRYDSSGGKERKMVKKDALSLLWSVLAAVCGVLVWYQLWRSGALHSLEELALAIGSGASIGETFSAFCLEILENAQIS